MADRTKYGSPSLFSLNDDVLARCLARLEEQPGFYENAPALDRSKMQARALMVCAFTLNATAVWTTKLLVRGTFSMRTQRRFFEKRWRQNPADWGETAKSCFARALCGYSIKKDGVCVDRHLERTGQSPELAVDQWKEWFRLYEMMYGAGETAACIQWHIELLDWIALRGPKPKPWK